MNNPHRRFDPLMIGSAIAIALFLLMFGVAPAACLFIAWILALALSTLRAGLLEGDVWLEKSAVGPLVAGINLLFLLLLVVSGPSYLADPSSVRRNRPAVIGVTGYHLALDDEGKLGADFGPSPNNLPNEPYFEVPGIPGPKPGRNAVNFPVHFSIECQNASCTAGLSPVGLRRDFVVGMRKRGDELLLMAGAATLELGSEYLLQLDERMDSSRARHAPLQREIPISVDSQGVHFGACEIQRPESEGELILPVLEFRFLVTEGRCQLIPISRDDIITGRWINRGPHGGFDIPAHSFFRITARTVQWFPLEDGDIVAQLRTVGGAPLIPPDRVELEFTANEELELSVMRRRFMEVRLSEGRREACEAHWTSTKVSHDSRWLPDFEIPSAIPSWLFNRGTGCRRMLGELHALDFFIERKPKERSVSFRLDSEDGGWGHEVYLDLPFSSWILENKDGEDIPRRHILLTGRWPSGGSVGQQRIGEELLAVPFRLHGTTPYRAVLTLQEREVEGTLLSIADATQLREISEASARIELGPPDSRVILNYERPSSPHQLARATLYPILLFGVLMLGLAVGGHLTDWGTARISGGVGSTLALIFASAMLQKSLVAYSVLIHAPHDWEAFDQLLASAFWVPVALATGVAVALIASLFKPDWKAPIYSVLFGAALFLAGVARLLLFDRETLGPVRLIALAPALAALAWAFVVVLTHYMRAHRATLVARSRLLPAALHSLVMTSFALAVLSWWRDKGAMLIVTVPLVLAWLYYVSQNFERRHVGVPAVLLPLALFACLFGWPRGIVELWAQTDDISLPAVPVASGSACSTIPSTSEEARLMREMCSREVVGPERSVLEYLDQTEVLLDAQKTVSERRHPMRRLDWLEDGANNSPCNAIDRFPTRDAIEVGFVRTIVDLYRSDHQSEYLREELLPFGRGVTNSLLDDYAGLVVYLPQMPRGCFSTIGLLLCALLLMIVGHGRPWSSVAGGVALGAGVLLCGAGVLTIAANLDIFPMIAQSIPLLALRSHSALGLDAVALFLLTASLGIQRSGTTPPAGGQP